jgi:arylsulfatase A-like enzyme
MIYLIKTIRDFSSLNRICVLIVVLLLGAGAATAQEKPNIIIFYVDDLGWQDVQLNDVDDPCPYETPNIVELAEGGMNFTQAYSAAPTCSPSRAGIMTGQHPAKINITHVSLGSTDNAKDDFPLAEPYLDRHLNTDILTLADALKQNSYRTGHVGKWHVGLTSASYGFDFVDQTRGIHRSLADRTKDFATADDPQYPLSVEKYPPYSEKKPMGISYPYDQLTESAIQFMKENKDEPFFLNMCHWMVHWPVCTRNGELLEYYCDKMGQPFPPPVGDMTLPGQQNPYFAAMVTSVDWSLGRVMDYLKETDDPRSPGKKLIETTYIFFTSDNGGAEKRGPELISDNYPLKYGKQHTEEGGVRVTTIISGEGIPEASQFDGMLSQLDFFPTILNLTNTEITQEDQNNLFGLDISPVLFEQSQKIVDPGGVERLNLVWHFPHNQGSMKSSIREGDFKLYKQYTTGEFELYQLYENGSRKDLEEVINLATNPDYEPVVSRLSTKLESHLQANHANGPYLNPSYTGNTIDPVAVASTTYKLADRQAYLSLKNAPVKEAYVLYLDGDHPDVQYRVKFPAEISTDGYAVSAQIPENVPSYRFILIDSSNFQVYSEVKSALNDDLPYELTFRVKDSETDSLLQNISVFVDQEEIKTTEHGEALYILNNGNYNYRISHPDYADLESSLELIKDSVVQITLTPRAKTVVFSIHSEESNNPLSDISVLIGENEVSSGLNGAAIFFLANGQHEYTISHPDYFTSSSSLELANDTTIQISLVANKANIKFRTYSEDKALNNVILKLEGDSLATNQTGIALFQNLPRFEAYEWLASKEGYEDLMGTVNLQNDTTVNINLSPVTINGAFELDKLKLYPNPTHSLVFIESGAKIKRVDICELRGALLSTKEVNNSGITLDLSGYQNGIYIARIYRERQITASLKVVKSD